MLSFNLIVTASDGREYNLPLDSAAQKRAFSLGGLNFTVTSVCKYALPEIEISFVPEKMITLRRITLNFPLAQNNVGGADPVWIYDNDIDTNAFPGIRNLSEATHEFRSRELITLHSEAGDLNAGFTTFDRFFTQFRTDKNNLRIQFEMEDKPVRPGEEYALEKLALDDTLGGLEYFERYTQTLHDRYELGPMKPSPAGWSSWSCMYDSVTEKHVRTQIKQLAANECRFGADLIQIDDGWEKDNSFAAWWTNDERRFPHGIRALSEFCRNLGLRFGLWNAPGLVHKNSSRFKELRPYLLPDKTGSVTPAFDNVYGLDITKPEAIELAREMYLRGVNEYGCVYFKIDFIVNLLLRIADGENVVYPGDYAAAQYRRYFKEIRKVVGDDVFLLACGAPIGESIGIFDSIRASADIAFNANMWWDIIRQDAQAIIMRSPYHGKVFINDPDALIVRDYLCPYNNDGVKLTFDEARTWATVVAMSGGHILINEELEKIGKDRRALFANILPPYGRAARPKDFYEFPQSTEAFIRVDESTVLVALYNWSADPGGKRFDPSAYVSGRALLVDCWTHEPICCTSDPVDFSLGGHASRAFLVKEIPQHGGFLYNDGNFYLGCGGLTGHDSFDYYYCPNGSESGMEPVQGDVLDCLYKEKHCDACGQCTPI